jgi:type VI secretion system protein ImpG
MDPRLLHYYNRELQHLREMGGEFAKEYPKVASRLTLDEFDCADPYVERLLEGFAFLAARVQLKLDAEFPRFTQHLLEMVYPHYLTPTPSMAMVQFNPDRTEGGLADGFVIERRARLRSPLGLGDQTSCEFRTAHDVTLWPLEITEAEYFSAGTESATLNDLGLKGVRAGLRLRLRTTAGVSFKDIALDRLPIYLRGIGDLPGHLYEQLVADPVAVLARPTEHPAPWSEVIDRRNIRRVGFEDDEALLPRTDRSFSGYRLLHEYFAFPERYMIIEIGGLQKAVRRNESSEMDVLVFFRRTVPALEGALDATHFALFCTPALNLFPRRADRIRLSDRVTEHHVLADRTRPLDFEVYSVDNVAGHGTGTDDEVPFLPFYALNDLSRHREHSAYFSLRRVPRKLSSKQRRHGPRSSYVGSEVYLSLVDTEEAPYRSSLRQLSMDLFCTNRDLPLSMSVGSGRTDFTLEASAPVESVRCVAGPTRPRQSLAQGDVSWRLISHLSLNYLSLMDENAREGAAALRELLNLYGGDEDANLQKQIEAVRSIKSRPVVRRLPISGPGSFGRGLELRILFHEKEFGGTGFLLLGAVLERFFARYVSINSFTETVLETDDRGEVMRWSARTGLRHLV